MTPTLDAVLVDIKFYANLDGKDWSDPDKYLANAGTGIGDRDLQGRARPHGAFTDPYIVRMAPPTLRAARSRRITLMFPAVQPRRHSTSRPRENVHADDDADAEHVLPADLWLTSPGRDWRPAVAGRR